MGVNFGMPCKKIQTVWRKPLSLERNLLVPIKLPLGDNIFYGSGLKELLQSNNDPDGGIIYAYHVHDPERYGVVEFDKEGRALPLRKSPKPEK